MARRELRSITIAVPDPEPVFGLRRSEPGAPAFLQPEDLMELVAAQQSVPI